MRKTLVYIEVPYIQPIHRYIYLEVDANEKLSDEELVARAIYSLDREEEARLDWLNAKIHREIKE